MEKMSKTIGFLVILILAMVLGMSCSVREFSNPIPGRDLVDYGDFTEVNGMDIHIWTEGTDDVGKTPIILIHGFTASLYTWRFNIEELGREFPVYALDLPGFGFSDKPLNFDYSLSGYADFIVAFMDEMGIKKAVLVGNSMGGGIAIKTFSKYPERVEGLVLIDALAYPGAGMIFGFKLMKHPVIGKIMMSMSYRFVIKHLILPGIYYDKDFITDDVIDSYYDVYKTENARKVPRWVSREIIRSYPIIEEEIKGISVPTLIIWGEDDHLIPEKNATYFARDITDSQLEIIPKAGHMPHEEKSAEVNSLIKDFLYSRLII